MPTRAAAAAAVGGVVYVVGGTTPAGNTAAVWAFERGEWRARTPLPAPRFDHEAVALGGRLYLLGGFAGGREHAEVYAYEPRRDRRTLLRGCRGRSTPSAPSPSAAGSG